MDDEQASVEVITLLEGFYGAYNPHKIIEINKILKLYEGRVTNLLSNLKAKYDIESYPPFDEYLSRKEEESAMPDSPERTGLPNERIHSPDIENVFHMVCSDPRFAEMFRLFEERWVAREKTWYQSLVQFKSMERDDLIKRLREEVRQLKSALQQCEENKLKFCQIYSRKIQKILHDRSEIIQGLTETINMQHEEWLSEKMNDNFLDEDLNMVRQVEEKRELQRYRFELISALNRETDLRNNVRYLQTQLFIAAEAVSAAKVGKHPYWDDSNCV